jgi:predicted enzyme related to lactoylglutathione lyase
MPERPDPFTGLRRAAPPLAPDPAFAATLRRRLQEELGMPITTVTPDPAPAVTDGSLVMVHLRVPDADRAARFYGELFGWQAERVEMADHVSHYTINTATTVRLLDDPAVPPVVPNYAVADVAGLVRAVEEVGGRVSDSDVAPDGGGWARGDDNQGVPWLAYRPGGYHEHDAPSRTPSGEVGMVFIRADAGRAARFYGRTLGWRLQNEPGHHYYDTVEGVGLFDEAAAFGQEVTPSATLYVSVDAIAPALRRVEELGGHAGDAAHDMGPYFSALCTDDQGTTFGLMSLRET